MIHKKRWSLKNTSHTKNILTHSTKCDPSEVWEQLTSVTQWRRETSTILVKSWETRLLLLLLPLLRIAKAFVGFIISNLYASTFVHE